MQMELAYDVMMNRTTLPTVSERSPSTASTSLIGVEVTDESRGIVFSDGSIMASDIQPRR